MDSRMMGLERIHILFEANFARLKQGWGGVRGGGGRIPHLQAESHDGVGRDSYDLASKCANPPPPPPPPPRPPRPPLAQNARMTGLEGLHMVLDTCLHGLMLTRWVWKGFL